MENEANPNANSQNQPTSDEQKNNAPEHQSLIDELGVKDLNDIIIPSGNKLFAAAGREAPIVEFSGDSLIMHHPHLPLVDGGPEEKIIESVDPRGILLDELSIPKKIPAAKYKGLPIYVSGELEHNSTRHIAVVLDNEGSLHFIYDQEGKRLTAPDIYRLRNSTFDGEISACEGIKSFSLDE